MACASSRNLYYATDGQLNCAPKFKLIARTGAIVSTKLSFAFGNKPMQTYAHPAPCVLIIYKTSHKVHIPRPLQKFGRIQPRASKACTFSWKSFTSDVPVWQCQRSPSNGQSVFDHHTEARRSRRCSSSTWRRLFQRSCDGNASTRTALDRWRPSPWTMPASSPGGCTCRLCCCS